MSTTSTTTTLASNMQNNSNISVDQESDGWISKTPKIVFLAVFIGIGFVGNLFFLLTISQSRKYRSMAFFIFLSNLAIVNICECLLNMSLVFGASILDEWKFGDIACRVSSFFIYIISKETFLALTITTADRFVATRFKDKYNTVVSRPRIAILITFTWVQSFSLSLPIAIGSVPSGVNKYIVYCTLSKGSSIVYAMFSVLLCFVVPILLIILFFVKIIRTGCKNRYVNRNLTTQSDNYSDDTSETPQYKQDFQNLKLTGTLCVAWLIMEGPYVFTSYYAQFKLSSELSNDTTEDTVFVWYVDLVLLWLRFSFTMALPVIAFTWNKDLWKCGKDFILCRKNNSVIDESFKKPDSDTVRLERKLKEERMKEKESMMHPREQRVFQVPVLFATSHGVHIKTSIQNDSSGSETDVSNKTGTLTGRKCDVVGSRDNIQAADEDTSDYDSGNELDPFSVSHPICVRQINKDDGLRHDKRSLSESEVRAKKAKKANDEHGDGNATSTGDSGVDLTSPQISGINRNQFHAPNKAFMLQNSMTLQTEMLETNMKTLQKKPGGLVSKYSNLSNTIIENDSDIDTIKSEPDSELDSSSVTKLNVKNETETNSPIPKRKKKRRKDKLFDTQSITSLASNSGLPPRPPPRLAPIINNTGTMHASPSKPAQTYSSQNVTNNSVKHGALVHRENTVEEDNVNTDATSEGVIPNGSFNTDSTKRSRSCTLECPNASENMNDLRLSDTVSKCVRGNGNVLQLDCDMEVDNDTEDILTPSDCHVLGSFSNRKSQDKLRLEDKTMATILNGALNQGFDDSLDSEIVKVTQQAEEPLTKVRNTEARKKRRQKYASTELITDGYRRLVTIPSNW